MPARKKDHSSGQALRLPRASMVWRRRWARLWDEVKYCSERCRCSHGQRGSLPGATSAHLLQHRDASGAFNACAPEAVRNADFTRTLARTLHRPALLPAPTWALRLALGEMSVLLLGGQHVVPRRAQESGITWHHPHIS